VGGLGQGRKPQGKRQAGIVGERVEVVDAGPAGAFCQQQRADRPPGAELAGGRVASLGDQPVQAKLGHGGKQQQQPGMVAWQAGAGGPGGELGGLDRVQASWAAAAALVAAGQPGQPFGGQGLPDRLGGDRQAVGGERAGDLGDAVVLGTQPQDLGAQLAGGFAWSLRAWLAVGEQPQLARAQQGGHLVNRRGGVAEPVGDLGGGQVLHEVGPQRLIPPLGDQGRLEEVFRSLPQPVSMSVTAERQSSITLALAAASCGTPESLLVTRAVEVDHR
jgi:hypothetical protein